MYLPPRVRADVGVIPAPKLRYKIYFECDTSMYLFARWSFLRLMSALSPSSPRYLFSLLCLLTSRLPTLPCFRSGYAGNVRRFQAASSQVVPGAQEMCR